MALGEAAERLRVTQGIDPQILIVLSTAQLACADIFYLAYANDVRGIGYQHEDAREVFDDTPQSRLEGIAFLNDYPYWQANPAEFSKDFRHEIAHRWAARVDFTSAGAASNALLGRQLKHWSYFLNTGGSPLEGNAWKPTDEQGFVADTPLALADFSDFDMYLMGALPAEDVRAEALITTTDAPNDCLSHGLSRTSPPQTCGTLLVSGQSQLVDIRSIIEAEGERSPPPDPGVRTVDVAVLVFEDDDAPLDAPMCHSLSAALQENIDSFERATQGRVVLRNVGESALSCDDVVVTATESALPAQGCTVHGRRPKNLPWLSVAVFAILALRFARTARSACQHSRWL